MHTQTIPILILFLLAILPTALDAFPIGPPIRHTGAQIDGGQNCTACHRSFPVNSGPGRVTIRANSYSPGVKQNITIEIVDPNALRWGFQITARRVSDETKQAGSFAANDNIRVQCDPGTDAPCAGGAREFASHRLASTRASSGGPSQTYVLDWTPPGNDVGEVIFYAAANAANNDNTPINDRIYTTSARVGAEGCNLGPKPGIRTTPATGVVNGASFLPGVSSNSLISIFGGGFAALGNSYRAVFNDLDIGKLPTQLACVALELEGKRAPIFYVQNDQINAQAPIFSGTGAVNAVVILNPGRPNELRSDPVSVNVTAVNPAFFTYAGTKSIASTDPAGRFLADPAVVPGGFFAKPGDVVVLYGTGFGFTQPVYQPGEFVTGPTPLNPTPTVTIGGTTLAAADVLYAGLSPDAPGFYQFNVRIPASASDGNIPVVMRIGGASTPTDTTIPVRR